MTKNLKTDAEKILTLIESKESFWRNHPNEQRHIEPMLLIEDSIENLVSRASKKLQREFKEYEADEAIVIAYENYYREIMSGERNYINDESVFSFDVKVIAFRQFCRKLIS